MPNRTSLPDLTFRFRWNSNTHRMWVLCPIPVWSAKIFSKYKWPLIYFSQVTHKTLTSWYVVIRVVVATPLLSTNDADGFRVIRSTLSRIIPAGHWDWVVEAIRSYVLRINRIPLSKIGCNSSLNFASTTANSPKILRPPGMERIAWRAFSLSHSASNKSVNFFVVDFLSFLLEETSFSSS